MKIKTIIKVVCSIAFAIVLFFGLQRLVEPKYAEDILEGNFTAEYYEETTEHDVLFVGDCEVYENFDPMYLWKNYGITSYIRGNAQQLAWQSYYMLEDTLKYETPKVVIYNVQSLGYAEPQKEEYNRMTLDGMKWSKTKYDAIKASMCKDENMLDYVFPLLRYHQRCLELSKSDFTYFWNNRKVAHNGYYMRVDVLPASESDVADPTWLLGDTAKDKNTEEEIEDPWSDIEESEEEIEDPWSDIEESEEDIEDPWSDIEESEDDTEDTCESNSDEEKNEDDDQKFGSYPIEYLEKMRVLCEEKGIQLILIKAPSLAPEWYASQNAQVVEYAEKHNLPYINFYELLDETGIDYETDTYDGGLHMNLSGAGKLSDYLGNVLTNEYGIEDYRNDTAISDVYKEKYQFYEDMIQAQKKELKEYGEIRSY